MKKILLCLFAIFVGTAAIAEKINWYLDGDIYNTTTCETGDDIILPTAPEKYGYTFKGWKKNYLRGTFDTWKDIPSTVTNYMADNNDNRTPLQNDYIFVRNTSSYQAPILVMYNGTTHTFNLEIEGEKYNNIPRSNIAGTYGTKKQITIQTWGTETGWVEVHAGLDNYITKTIGGALEKSNALLCGASRADTNWTCAVYVAANNYGGTWQFFYDGIWAEHGKNGWKPKIQINNE